MNLHYFRQYILSFRQTDQKRFGRRKKKHINSDCDFDANEQFLSGRLSLVTRYDIVLQIRRGKRDNLEIIFHITPLTRMVQPSIRTVSPRRF